ncbi:uncharacterized protein LOC134188929 [Corticium candelabrum]|uniref:uncharacterized protein LOC134188929 n=1 Tax=Corticium candelabrum TaxID=121492 RepID=UPI002E254CD5|nr:uncharacterized protein LOC134188929 [Corticium candelabrum]
MAESDMNSNLFISVAIVWICFIHGSFTHETGDSTHSESPEVQVCQPLQSYLKQTQMTGLDNMAGFGGKGEKGSPGKMGPRGLRGFKGSTGDIGIQGREGLRGLQGPKGLHGLKGVKGKVGIQGPIGLEGRRGLQGFKGSKGEIGFPGYKGDIGFPGSKGSLGSKGAKGNVGPVGPKGSKGDVGAPGVVKPVSSLNNLPWCGASTRGSLSLLPVSVNSALTRDAVMICADLENGNFQWIELMTKTNGLSSCRELKQSIYSSVLQDGLYNITDSKMHFVTAYCDMTTDGGGWLLIGKSFQPNVRNLGSTSEPVTLTSEQGWSNRFPSILVNDFRVQFSTSRSVGDTKGHWYYHFSRPRSLAQLFTSGYDNSNNCRYEDGISDIEYTVDIRGGTKNINHRCSAFQDYYSANSFNEINNCFNSANCSISGSDGSFSFHGQNAISGQDTHSTAFFGCDDDNCCACWGPTGGQESYCNNCGTTNVSSKQSSGYAWFYVR